MVALRPRRARLHLQVQPQMRLARHANLRADQPAHLRIQVRIPGGFEYDEAEIAMSKVLKGSGAIAFDLAGTHSSLAHVSRRPDN